MTRDNKKLSVWLVVVLMAAVSATAAGKEIFIAPDGEDANPGTEARPFATLGRAQKAARAAGRQEPVTVLLKTGTYYFSTPLLFGPADSGTAEAPVTYAARPGARVVISAGRRLHLQWLPHKNGIWRADTRSVESQIDQLFVDGQRRPIARWPNYRQGDYGVDVGYSRGLTPHEGKPASQLIPPLQDYAGFAFDPEKFTTRTWAHPERAMLHVFQSHRWGNMQWRLATLDYENHVIQLGEGGGQIGTLWNESRANWINANSNYYIENVYEELDAPGEWYHDAQEHVLYYMPAEGDDLARADVVACGLKELVIFQGTAEQPVKHVHLRGLSFQHTGRTLMEPYETRLRGDWAIARRAAVRFDGASDCSVTDCQFTRLGGNAVLLSNYNRRVRVVDSLFTDIGDSAVLVVGANDAVRELRVHQTHHVPLDQLTDLKPGPKSPNYPGDCCIGNNLMYRLGIFGKQVAGVYLSACERIRVSHNTICLVPRAAICINDGCWGGHTIEFNDAFLTVLETSDHGPINAWGRDRYWQSLHRENRPCDMSLSRKYALLDNYLPTVIRNNRFVADGFSWGIDLDDGASNYVVTNNLCLGCSVKLREGFFRRVQNNIFVGPNPPNKHCCFVGSDDVYTDNIYVNTRDHWALNRGPATVVLPKEIDRNVYWNTAGKAPVFGYRGPPLTSGRRRRTSLSFAEWQELGADRNSVLADPLFVDADHQDFRLRRDAPALRLGFKEFPLDRFGTQKPEFLAVIEKQGLRGRVVSPQPKRNVSRNEPPVSTTQTQAGEPDGSTRDQSYLGRTTTCVDLLMEHATDTYGPIHSPILVSILDVKSRLCPENPRQLDESWRVTRRGRRNPAGANLLSDNALLKTMDLLSDATGNRRYADFARQYRDYYMKHLVDERGFLWWGWHRHYDVFKDEKDGHNGNYHEIHAINCIDWESLWAVNQPAVLKEIKAIWQWHVIDKETGEINRHGDGRRGCDFSMSAGAIIEAFAFLHVKTRDKTWLDRAKLVANYYWTRRNPNTNLFPERPNAGKDRFDGSSFVTSITGPYCHSLLKAYAMTGETVFKDQAAAILNAYAEFGFDKETGKFWGALQLDGTPVPGPRVTDEYAKYEPRGYLDLWEPYAAGYQYAIYTAQSYVYAYELTKDPIFLKTAKRFASWIKRTPPGTAESDNTWYQEYSEGPGRQGTYAGKYGRTISFLLHLYVLTGERQYLEDARALADTAIAKLCHNGLFRGHPAKPYYEAMDGVGYLLYALLELDQVRRAPETVVADKAIVVGSGPRKTRMELDNW